MIPKIIHFCWLSSDPFPKEVQEYMQSWSNYFPEYKIMHWKLETDNVGENIWVKQAFQNKKYAFAADYIRLFALYHYGGVYLDTDVEVCKNSRIIEGLPYLIGSEGNGIIEAADKRAQKNADWIKCCLDYYDDREFLKKDGGFDMRTLPSIMMQQLTKKYTITEKNYLNAKISGRENQLYMLPKEFLSPKNMGTGEIHATENTITIHHFNMSWLDGSGKKMSDFKRKLIQILGANFILFCIKFFKLKKLKDLLLKP